MIQLRISSLMTATDIKNILFKHVIKFFVVATLAVSSMTTYAVSTGYYTIQQVSNKRYLDAYTNSDNNYQLVTRISQDNDTQKWLITDLGGGRHSIQHKKNNRYVDAYINSSDDYSLVTRNFQNNNTQKWTITSLGDDQYSVRHAQNNRFMDAYQDSSDADFRVITRPLQKNNTQKWIIKKTRVYNESDLCSGTITLNGDKLKYCRDKSIYTKDSNVKRAVIYMHGSLSNAKKGYNKFMKDRKEEGLGSETTIIAPHFFRDSDHSDLGLESNHPYWYKNEWAYGYPAKNSDKTSSYTWMDYIVKRLLEEKPNLKQIIIAGFSAGGQFVNHYAAFTNIVDEAKKHNVKVKFIVGAPSMYLYLSEDRPGENCDDCNEYPYGLEDRSKLKYGKNVSDNNVVRNVISRNIWYAIGGEDTSGWTYIRANAQGENRLDRHIKYKSHLNWTCEFLHPGQCSFESSFLIAPGVSHSLTVFDLPTVRKIIYTD